MTIRHYGPPHASPIGPRQTNAIPTTPAATPPIPLKRYARNGRHPDAGLANRINEAANQAIIYRPKEVFSYYGGYVSNGSFYVNKNIWHFCFHTGPYTSSLFARLLMNSPFSSASNSKGTVTIYSDAALTTSVASQDFNYGPGQSSGASPYVFGTYRAIDKYITGLTADTDYYGVVSGSGYAYIPGACIWECPSLTDSAFAGYLSTSFTTHTPIIALDRTNAHTLLKNAWKRGGSKVLNWAVTPGNTSGGDSSDGYSSITTTSTTYTNIVDQSSTAVSASTPGWTLDLRYKDRVSQTSGVPVVMKAVGYASAANDLSVVIKNSAGTVLATVSGFTTTLGWVSSGQFNLPATAAKYDIQFKSANIAPARAHLYGLGIYEYEA